MKEKKSLQKFTDFENVKTKEDFQKFQKLYPKKMDKLSDFVYKRLNEVANASVKKEGELDRYFNRAVRLRELTNDEDGIKTIRRDQWYVNESLINQYVNNYLAKHRFIPSASDIARETGISRQTVHKHLANRKTSELYNEQIETLRGLTHSVLSQLYKIGIEESNVKALKVFVDYFKEGNQQQGTQINTQNNFIQINGLTISQQQIQQLSADKIGQLQDLLKPIPIDNLQKNK